MNTPVLFLSVLFFVIAVTVTTAQTRFIYRQTADTERLLRTETYSSQGLTDKVIYLADGRPATRFRYRYNELGQLEEEVTTNLNGHEWDIIRRNQYDAQGRLSVQLQGNNYNGKWVHHQFRYNARGDVDTVLQYLKSGPLYKRRVNSYTYDTQGRPQSLNPQEIAVDGRLISQGVRQQYRYLGNDVQTTHTDSTGTLIFTETVRYDSAGRKVFEEQRFPDGTRQKTVYTYDAAGRIQRAKEYFNGRPAGGWIARAQAPAGYTLLPSPDGYGYLYLPEG